MATLLFTGLLLLNPSTAKLTHFITQNTSSQALAPDKNIPAAFYTKAFLHPSSPDTFYTRHLLYQAHLHQKPFRPDTFYTRHILHEAPFTPDTSYTNRLLHQTTFTPGTFYTNQLLHQTTFTPDNFYTNQTFTPDTFYTNQLLHQTPFTPTSFYTRHLLHQTPFTPGTFYTRHLLHQTTFTPNTFYTNRLLHQTTWQFYFSLVYLFWTPLQQPSGHYIPYITCFFPQPEKPKSRVPFCPKVESLFFPKNWQLYFSVVYLFLTPLQQNSGHYIPFPQPENLKSRVPFFRKIGSSTFQWLTSGVLTLYSKTPATTSHFHSQKTSKVESLFFRKIGNSTFHGFTSSGPLLPCYFCSSRPSTARPPPVHRIIPFNLAPPSLASSHAISAPPARPPPVHRITPFNLAPPSLASSHAISAAPARPQPVHRPSTGSSTSISLLHL